MLKWEYKVIDLIKEIEKKSGKVEFSGYWLSTLDLEKILNKQGAEGWELIDIHFMIERQETVVVGFFKRPLIANVEE